MGKTFIMIIGAALLNIIITINTINAQPNQPPPRSYLDGNFFYNKMRSDLTSVLINDKIFFFGAETFNKSDSNRTTSNELFTLDVSSLDLNNNNSFNTESMKDKWELLDSMKVGLRYNVMALSARDDYSTIIFYGGETFNPNTDEKIDVDSQIYEYNINANKWTMNPKYQGKPPPQRLSFASYVQKLEDGMIYLFGGISDYNPKGGGKINNKLYSIDTNDKRWNEVTTDDTPPGVFGSTCTMLKDGKIIFIGGANFGDSNELILSQMSNLNIYDTVNGKWSIRSTSDKDLPEGRVGHTATLHDNKIIIIGGKNVNNEKASVPYFIYLDLDKWVWKNLAADQANYNGFARFGHNTILHDDHLFVTFGQSTNKNDDINPIEAINTDNLEIIIQPPKNSNKEEVIATFNTKNIPDSSSTPGENNDNNPTSNSAPINPTSNSESDPASNPAPNLDPDIDMNDDDTSSDTTPDSDSSTINNDKIEKKNNSIVITFSVVGGIFLILIILASLLIIHIKRRKLKLKINNDNKSSVLPVTTRNISNTRRNILTMFRDSTSTHNTTYTDIVNRSDGMVSIGEIQNANNVKNTTVKPKTPTVIYASGVSSIFADLAFTGSIEYTKDTNDAGDDNQQPSTSGGNRSLSDLDTVEEVPTS